MVGESYYDQRPVQHGDAAVRAVRHQHRMTACAGWSKNIGFDALRSTGEALPVDVARPRGPRGGVAFATIPSSVGFLDIPIVAALISRTLP